MTQAAGELAAHRAVERDAPLRIGGEIKGVRDRQHRPLSVPGEPSPAAGYGALLLDARLRADLRACLKTEFRPRLCAGLHAEHIGLERTEAQELPRVEFNEHRNPQGLTRS